MSGGAASFAARRRALVARSAVQRQDLAASLGQLAPSLATADRVLHAAGWVRRHGRVVAVAAVVALAVLAVRKPARMLGWAGKAWTLWQLWRQWEGQINALMAHVARRPRSPAR